MLCYRAILFIVSGEVFRTRTASYAAASSAISKLIIKRSSYIGISALKGLCAIRKKEPAQSLYLQAKFACPRDGRHSLKQSYERCQTVVTAKMSCELQLIAR
jgi:hypothetical protein